MLTSSDIIAVASLLVALVALIISVVALSRSDINASAAAMISLFESCKNAWTRFLKAQGNDQELAFGDLANVLEVACAILAADAMHGITKQLLRNYIDDQLRLLDRHDDTSRMMTSLRGRESTFKYLHAELLRSREGLSLPGA